MPTDPKAPPKSLINLDVQATAEQIQNGRNLFSQYCTKCHSEGIIPDLTYSQPEIFESYQQIVGEGIFIRLGMHNYGDRLSENDINDIKIIFYPKLNRKESN